jgi:PAS domain S-box-containing protein
MSASELQLDLDRDPALIEAVARMAHIGMWELDAATLQTRWSREVFRIHEIDPGTHPSFSEAVAFYAPEARSVVDAAVRCALGDGTPFDLTLPFVTAGGRARWVRALGVPESRDGKIVRLCGAFQDVTEDFEKQGRLQRATLGSAEGHWESDLRQRTAWLSAKLQELLGEPAAERMCPEEDFRALIHPDDAPRVNRAVAQHFAHRVPYEVEVRMHHRDGSYRWYRSRASGEFDAHGTPLRFGGSLTDIHRERLARDELEELRRRHDRAVRGAQDGVWEWNMRQESVWYSPRMLQLLELDQDGQGYPTTPEAFLRLVHPEDVPRMEAANHTHLVERLPYDVELRLRSASGEYRWYRSRATAERDADGQPIALSGSVQDIHAQKLAEAGRRDAEARLARAIDGSRDALFEHNLDSDGAVWYSQRLKEMLGYGPEDQLPASVLTLMNDADRAAVRAAAERHFADDTPFDVTFRLPTRSGGERWIRARGRCERDAGGIARRFSGSLQDITEQRETEEALRQATRAAGAANRAKSDFLANMSHEIRTPMNGVLGMTDLLLDGPLAPEQREFAEAIRGSAGSLLAIINDVLDLSKIEAGKMVFEQVPMNPRNCLELVRSLTAPQAARRGLEFITEVAPTVPDQVVSDPHRFQQVLMNLVGNAVKFTHSGKITVRLALQPSEPSRPILECRVQDSGVGMDAATLARLYTPFTQADASTTRHYGGSGLGLSIVRRLINQIGGSIEVESAPGVGSTFTVSWPCAFAASDAPHPALPLAPRTAAGVGTLYSAHVLVVEDHPVNQQVICRLLQRFGCRVTVADNGALGVAAAAAQRFDLVLMDVQMPVLDGLEATRQVRGLETGGRRVPIVALTASAMTDELERCQRAGMDDLLTKPIDRVQLDRVLERYLRPADTGLAETTFAPPGPLSPLRVRAAAAPAGPELAWVDERALNELGGRDAAFQRVLIETFQLSTRSILAGLESALAREDRGALRAYAHKLHGGATAVHAPALAAAAATLEQEAQRASLDTLAQTLASMRRMSASTHQAMQSLLPIQHSA